MAFMRSSAHPTNLIDIYLYSDINSLIHMYVIFVVMRLKLPYTR